MRARASALEVVAGLRSADADCMMPSADSASLATWERRREAGRSACDGDERGGAPEFAVLSAEPVGEVMALEAAHTAYRALDAAMVLLEAVVQLGSGPVPDGLAQHRADRPGIGAITVRGTAKYLRSPHTAVLARHRVHQVPVPVDPPRARISLRSRRVRRPRNRSTPRRRRCRWAGRSGSASRRCALRTVAHDRCSGTAGSHAPSPPAAPSRPQTHSTRSSSRQPDHPHHHPAPARYAQAPKQPLLAGEITEPMS